MRRWRSVRQAHGVEGRLHGVHHLVVGSSAEIGQSVLDEHEVAVVLDGLGVERRHGRLSGLLCLLGGLVTPVGRQDAAHAGLDLALDAVDRADRDIELVEVGHVSHESSYGRIMCDLHISYIIAQT